VYIPIEERNPEWLYVHSRRSGERITFELLLKDYPDLFLLKSEMTFLLERRKALRNG